MTRVTDDAYVRGDLTPLSTKVAGIVRNVPVSDYQQVHKGELWLSWRIATSRHRLLKPMLQWKPAGLPSRTTFANANCRTLALTGHWRESTRRRRR